MKPPRRLVKPKIKSRTSVVQITKILHRYLSRHPEINPANWYREPALYNVFKRIQYKGFGSYKGVNEYTKHALRFTPMRVFKDRLLPMRPTRMYIRRLFKRRLAGRSDVSMTELKQNPELNNALWVLHKNNFFGHTNVEGYLRGEAKLTKVRIRRGSKKNG